MGATKKPRAGNEQIEKFEDRGVEVWLKRLDQQDPVGMGNKIYKLRYNLDAAAQQGENKLLTFGGAFSNHIAAVAAMGQKRGFETIGIIRGEELGRDLAKTLIHNTTLRRAKEAGMQFEFVSRKAYREKQTPAFKEWLQQKHGRFYSLPEGGTNALAIKGCKEILEEDDKNFEVICCPVGTGGTLAGLIEASFPDQKILGFSALRVDMYPAVKALVNKNNWQVFPDTIFGGFAKTNHSLISFINDFKKTHGVLLDPIYTGKMMARINDKIKRGDFPKKTRILALHTGGLQGISGMNKRLKKKGLPVINCEGICK